VRYQPIAGLRSQRDEQGLPISASPHNTAPGPTTPFVAPGAYTVRLTVAGKSYNQPITVRQDPRVSAPQAALREIYALTDSMYWTLTKLQESIGQARTARGRLTDSVVLGRIAAILDAPAPPDTSIRGAPPAARRVVAAQGGQARNQTPPAAPTTLTGASNGLAALLNSLQSADEAITATERAAIDNALRNASTALARWASYPR
jgi:hypothetical protein